MVWSDESRNQRAENHATASGVTAGAASAGPASAAQVAAPGAAGVASATAARRASSRAHAACQESTVNEVSQRLTETRLQGSTNQCQQEKNGQHRPNVMRNDGAGLVGTGAGRQEHPPCNGKQHVQSRPHGVLGRLSHLDKVSGNHFLHLVLDRVRQHSHRRDIPAQYNGSREVRKLRARATYLKILITTRSIEPKNRKKARD